MKKPGQPMGLPPIVQAPSIPASTLGQPNGPARLNPDGSLTLTGKNTITNTDTLPSAGTNLQQYDVATVNPGPLGTEPGSIVSRNADAVFVGPGNTGQGGHVVGVKGRGIHSGTGTVGAIIGTEGSTNVTTTAGTADAAISILGYFEGNAGTIGTYYAFVAGYGNNNTGTVTTWIDFSSPLVTGGTIGAKYCLKNDDPNKYIFTLGPIQNSTLQEIGPTVSPGVIRGRYYYGLDGSANAANPFSLLAANTWFAPFYVPERTTWTRLGFNVVTAAAGGLCQAALYISQSQQPASSPVVITPSFDASTTGDKEATINVTLDAGFYWLGVMGNNNSIEVTAYQENKAQSVFGSTTSGGGEVTPYTPSAGYGTWVTSPPLFFFNWGNTAGAMPKIWMRK
jgi:hypothetical protein